MRRLFILFFAVFLISLASAAKPIISSCTDSDSGINPNTAGYIQTNSILADSCSGNDILERFCSGNSADYSVFACQQGYICNPTASIIKIAKKTYNLAACVQNLCGNGIIDSGEACDANTQACTINNYKGIQSCSSNCQWNSCTLTENCGDSIINGLEQCDSGNNNGISCTPEVNSNCTYCDSSCQSVTLYGQVIQNLPEINGTSGNDIFQIKYNHVYLNNIDKGAVSPNLVLNGLDGNDTFTAIGSGSQIIRGGNGFDTFWIDSTDTIIDASSEETNGLNSPVPSVHIINEYYQPWTTDSSSPDYVSLETNGQQIKEPVSNAYFSYIDFSSKPLIISIEYNDAIQGGVGDCYFLASLSSIADSDPEVIKQSVVSLGDNTYAIRFYRNSQPVYLRVSSKLPSYTNSLPTYAQLSKDKELWAPLLEKAYTYFRYSQNSYSSISGGWMQDVYTQLTNKPAGYSFISGFTNDAISSYVSDNFNNNHAVSAASYTNVTFIVGNHAYALPHSVNSNLPLNITAYNVWGQDGNGIGYADSNPADGLMTFSLDVFKQNYQAICNSSA